MNELEDYKNTLKMIAGGTTFSTQSHPAQEALDRHKPKDSLFEKWEELLRVGFTDKRGSFNRAKELGLFTAGLDEAIETIDNWCHDADWRYSTLLKEIKERINNEHK